MFATSMPSLSQSDLQLLPSSHATAKLGQIPIPVLHWLITNCFASERILQNDRVRRYYTTTREMCIICNLKSSPSWIAIIQYLEAKHLLSHTHIYTVCNANNTQRERSVYSSLVKLVWTKGKGFVDDVGTLVKVTPTRSTFPTSASKDW